MLTNCRPAVGAGEHYLMIPKINLFCKTNKNVTKCKKLLRLFGMATAEPLLMEVLH